MCTAAVGGVGSRGGGGAGGGGGEGKGARRSGEVGTEAWGLDRDWGPNSWGGEEREGGGGRDGRGMGGGWEGRGCMEGRAGPLACRQCAQWPMSLFAHLLDDRGQQRPAQRPAARKTCRHDTPQTPRHTTRKHEHMRPAAAPFGVAPLDDTRSIRLRALPPLPHLKLQAAGCAGQLIFRRQARRIFSGDLTPSHAPP
ncbi:hypothetical protein BDZ91DRAFT_832747 [Kalaharituber pfeilii]|nr:hypothetical protein BDZ91DRAFT_832747 [Kalaharituber pfeilii]